MNKDELLKRYSDLIKEKDKISHEITLLEQQEKEKNKQLDSLVADIIKSLIDEKALVWPVWVTDSHFSQPFIDGVYITKEKADKHVTWCENNGCEVINELFKPTIANAIHIPFLKDSISDLDF